MRVSILKILAAAGLPLLLQTGCVDVAKSDTGEAVLYVYDGASHAVLSWDDVASLYAGTPSAANRTLTSGKLGSLTLGWGGMALDGTNSTLYLVASSGTVVRLSRIDQQSGDVPSADAISFTLDDTDTDAAGGTFGQAAVSADGRTFYVTQCDSASGKSQIWAIPTFRMAESAKIDKNVATILANTGMAGGTNDKNCTGVAASSSGLYAYFDTGDTITPGTTDHSGSRLRRGTVGGAFPALSSVIVGANGNSVTLLGKYGSLAYDTGNDRLYVARHATDSALGGNPLLSFTPGQFSPGLEIAPERTLAGPTDLRVIAHGGKRDWLVGARSPATRTLWIWKAPSQEDASMQVDLPDTGSGAVQIQGLALDGSD